jgi:DUF1365 family protein
MNSKLYTGIVEHERFQPASHRLVYKLYMYALDLAELEALDQRFPFSDTTACDRFHFMIATIWVGNR